MKKLLAFILAFTVVFSMTAMFTPVSAAGASGKDSSGITYINYLDFSPENNKWDERDPEDPTKYLHTSFGGDDYVDQNGNPGGDYYPHALYYAGSGLKHEFKQNGEVIRLTATDTNSPYLGFEVASMNVYPLGREDDGKMEYVKIRLKNNSPSTKLTFQGTNPYSGSNLDSRVTATIDVEPNSTEWQEFIISMVDYTMISRNNTTMAGQNTWMANLKKFAIYPFGYNKDNEAIANDNYYVEIDYVVLGSEDYVKNYKSELQKKEESVSGFEFVNAVEGSNGKTLKPGTVQETYKLGESLNVQDLAENLKLNISYVENTYENEMGVSGDTVSAVYDFSKPEELPDSTQSWPATVTLKYGDAKLTYDVTVYNIKSIDYKYETDKATDVDNKVYDKLDILQNGFTPTGISVLVTHYAIDPSTGKEWETIKTMKEVELIGTDFTEKVELSEDGYYEYLISVNYFGVNLDPIPVKIKDVVSLKITPVADKAGAIYYGTDLNTAARSVTYGEDDNAKTYTVNDYFDIECVYTDGSTKALELTGLYGNVSVAGNTKTTGGNINATVTFANTAYGINIAQDATVNVQAPSDISVKLKGKTTFDVDDVLARDRFTVTYKYADGTTVNVDSADTNLMFKYDTSAPGSNLEGVLEVNGKKEATFKFNVDEAEFDEEVLQKQISEKVKLLNPKFPTVWLVTIICAVVVLLFVGGWALLKYVFKVDFKRKKRVSLDDIF